VRRGGLSGATPHTIRHTVASWLEDRVGDARRAQLLGHGNVETTRRVYTHSSAEMLTEAVSYLDFAPLPRIDQSEGSEARQ
jgi:integrase